MATDTDSSQLTDSPDDAEFERFMAETQAKLQILLVTSNLKQLDLSRRLGVSEQRVSQIFRGRGRNLTMRTVARIFDCVGEQPLLITHSEFRKLARRIQLLSEHLDRLSASDD